MKRMLALAMSAILIALTIPGCDLSSNDIASKNTASTFDSIESANGIASLVDDESISSYESNITLATEKLADAKMQAENACLEAGGRVMSSSFYFDEDEGTGYARLVCEIPNENFYEAVNAIRVLGDIRSENIEISYVDPNEDEPQDDIQWKRYGYERDKKVASEIAVMFVDDEPNFLLLAGIPETIGRSISEIIYIIAACLPLAVIAAVVVGLVFVIRRKRPTDADGIETVIEEKTFDESIR